MSIGSSTRTVSSPPGRPRDPFRFPRRWTLVIMTLRYYLALKKKSQINSIFSNNEWKADANENLDVLFLKRSILVSNRFMIYSKAIVKTMHIKKKKKRLNVQISESVLLAESYLWFSREAPWTSCCIVSLHGPRCSQDSLVHSSPPIFFSD